MLANIFEKFILKHFEKKLLQVGASQEMVHTFSHNLFSPESFIRHFFRLHSYDLGSKDRLEYWNAIMSLPDRIATTFTNELTFLSSADPQHLPLFPYDNPKTSIEPSGDYDATKALPFVYHNDKRLYFPAKYTTSQAKSEYKYFLETEGIIENGLVGTYPHRYADKSFKVEINDIILDIGCAEALFALDSIDTAKRVYCFEMLDCWKKPLAATFAPFGDKAKVIAKFVSDKTAGNEIRLDDAILPEDRDSTFFIKMDIEGGERLVLNAARDFLSTHRVKLAVAAYHRQDDADYLSQLLVDMGFEISFSDGWMLPEINGHKFPYFRRGVIRARNF